MSEFFSKYNKKFENIEEIPNFSLNNPYFFGLVKGDVGIEIELEGNRLPTQGHLEKVKGATSQTYWRVERDGSLRNGGLEYVLNTPAMLSEVPELVDGLWDVFKQLSSTLDLTNRCSTHVHVNMSNRKINEISSVLALWMVFEEALIAWNGEMRTSNHFCLSAKDSPRVTNGWLSFLKSGERRYEEETYKYASVNLCALEKYGSLEFRCGRGADSPEMVKNWTKFLHSMCEYAMRTYSNPSTLGYSLSEEGGRSIFNRICNQAGLMTFYDEVINSVENFDRSCISGFRNAQPFIMGIPWDSWMDNINRDFIPQPFGKTKKKSPEMLFIDEPMMARTAGGAIRGTGERITNPARWIDFDNTRAFEAFAPAPAPPRER